MENIKTQKIKDERLLVRYGKTTDPDYIIYEEEIDSLKKKIYEVRNILDNAKPLEPPEAKDTVDIGSKVIIEDEAEKESLRLHIVETLECNPAEGKISPNSPLGSALLGRKLKDIIFVPDPVRGRYEIKEIQFG